MRISVNLLFAALLLFFPFSAEAGEEDVIDGDAIVGIWATDKAEAHVEIFRTDEGYAGRIIWLKEPFFPADDSMAGRPKIDRENPDPGLRQREIIGLQIVQGFRYDGDGKWSGGTIYDPENGKTYKAKMWLTGDATLKVRGYVGVSLFGRTTEWQPVLLRSSQAVSVN